MPGLGPKLIAYGLVVLFCIPGPLGLALALNLVIHRAAFIHSAHRSDGTVIEMRPVHTTRTGAGTYIPVFRFTASDGRLHIIVSDVSVQRTAFRTGDEVQVLYQPDNAENAHIDALSTLWQNCFVVGIWGLVWSSIPVFILVVRRRARRRAAAVTS